MIVLYFSVTCLIRFIHSVNELDEAFIHSFSESINQSTYFPNSLTTLLQMEAELEDHVLDGKDHASSSSGAVADWYLNLWNMQFEIFYELVNNCISYLCMQKRRWFQQHAESFYI